MSSPPRPEGRGFRRLETKMTTKAETIANLINSIEYDKPNGIPNLMVDTEHQDFIITPHLNVSGFVDKLKQIVLNVSAQATGGRGVVAIGNYLMFRARFNQVAHTVTFHEDSVIAVFDANEDSPVNLLEQVNKDFKEHNLWKIFTRLMVFLQSQANCDLCLEVDLISSSGENKLVFSYDEEESIVCFKDNTGNKSVASIAVSSEEPTDFSPENFKVQYMTLKDKKAAKFLFISDTEKHIVFDKSVQEANSTTPEKNENPEPTQESLGPNVVDFSSFRKTKQPSL